MTRQALEDSFNKLDFVRAGHLSRGTLRTVFTRLGLDEGSTERVLDLVGGGGGDGRIQINTLIDFLYPEPSPDGAGSGTACARPGPTCSVDMATLNCLGNAYNAMEFMCGDATFERAYAKIRQAFAAVTTADVLRDMAAVGLGGVGALPDGTRFEAHCTQDFLRRDNKVRLDLRTNMVVGGMLPAGTGAPTFQHLPEWRELMRAQAGTYREEPELLAWDIACNLAAERCAAEYHELSSASYLNPELLARNVGILLDALPVHTGRDLVCAVQEFPEQGTAKYVALTREMSSRGLKHVRAEAKNSSVGFLLSSDIAVESCRHSPLGHDHAQLARALGGRLGDLSGGDRQSLETTAFKTLALDIAGAGGRPPMRLVSAHAKEFKTVEGWDILAHYLRQAAGDEHDRARVVALDANTPTQAMSLAFDAALRREGFDVLTPAGDYCTTQKMRSEMHGQIYNAAKCLKEVKAHKTFIAMVHDSRGRARGSAGGVSAVPCLRTSPQNLPNSRWPTDHCMLKVTLDFFQSSGVEQATK